MCMYAGYLEFPVLCTELCVPAWLVYPSIRLFHVDIHAFLVYPDIRPFRVPRYTTIVMYPDIRLIHVPRHMTNSCTQTHDWFVYPVIWLIHVPKHTTDSCSQTYNYCRVPRYTTDSCTQTYGDYMYFYIGWTRSSVESSCDRGSNPMRD